MKTKIVYVVASLDDDIYMEQAIVSAWSAKHHNPNCFITMVCDQDTFETTKSGVRNKYKSLFDEIVVKGFDASQGIMERSRWMKTSLRSIVDGDFLYLDTDTVVCGDLSYVDDFEFDLGSVLDQNCTFQNFLYKDGVTERTKRLFNVDLSDEKSYFNAGVLFVSDTNVCHNFFKLWHTLWKEGKQKLDGMKDQSAFASANIKMNHVITEMTGNINCQVMVSIQYLHTASIIHFYNTLFVKDSELSPFYGEKLFKEVKESGLDNLIQEKILNCKSLFSSPSMPIPLEQAIAVRTFMKYGANGDVLESKSFHLLLYIYNKKRFLFVFVEKILRACLRVYLVLHR